MRKVEGGVNPHPQSMPLVPLVGQESQDKQCLVNNNSINSFLNENNELTVTRSFKDRKYSTMCFKPTEKNRVDIVVTQGEYQDNSKEFLHLNYYSSQDIRRQYSGKARCLLVSVFVLLFVMLGILLICLFRTEGRLNTNQGGPPSVPPTLIQNYTNPAANFSSVLPDTSMRFFSTNSTSAS